MIARPFYLLNIADASDAGELTLLLRLVHPLVFKESRIVYLGEVAQELFVALAAYLLHRSETIYVVTARKEGESTDDVPVAVEPVSHPNPLVVPNLDSNGWVVLGVGDLHLLPVLKLVERGEMVLAYGSIRWLYRELEDEGVGGLLRLPNFRVIRHALLLHQFEERISRADTDALDVVWSVARMHAARHVERLTNGAGGLDAGDGRRGADAEALRIFLIGLYGLYAHRLQGRFVARGGRVPLAGDGDAEQALALTVVLPRLR